MLGDAVDDVASALELREVDSSFEGVAAAAGSCSSAARVQVLRALLGRATREERDFLVRLMFGELRQGALEGVLMEAVARASGVAAARIRRAAMLAGDLAVVASAALAGGEHALSRFILQPFQPVQPMLAQSASKIRREHPRNPLTLRPRMPASPCKKKEQNRLPRV